MKDRIVLKFESASARLKPIPDSHIMTLTNVFAGKRRQGHGHGLMKVVEDYADEHGIPLILRVRPYKAVNPEIIPNVEQLISFYQKHGFNVVEWGQAPLMERFPREKNPPYSERANSLEIAS